MRKIKLDDKELENIHELVSRGFTWSAIQREIGLDRRIVKRIYEEWQRSRSIEYLEEARKQLAIRDFDDHRAELIRLAKRFVEYLDIPKINYSPGSAQVFIESFFERPSDSEEVESKPYGATGKREQKEARRRQRKNRLLFRALRQHTSGQVCWEVLEDWKKSCDNCFEKIPELSQEALHYLRSYLDKYLARGVELNELSIREAAQIGVGLFWDSLVARSGTAGGNGENISEKKRQNPEKKSIRDITDLVPDALYSIESHLSETEVGRLVASEAGRAEKAAAELEEMLDPVILHPLIIKTRCFLCPI